MSLLRSSTPKSSMPGLGMSGSERIVVSGGHAVRVRTYGSAGPAFALVPGIGVTHRYFLPLAAELASRATVYIVELLHLGRAPTPDTIEDIAALMWAGLDRLRVQRPVLVGHSMGSQVVVEMARTRPDLPTAVVLLSPVANARERSALVQALRLGSDFFAESLDANRIVITDSVRCGPRSYARMLRAVLTYPTEERIGDIAAPVLILRGQRDPVVPHSWARELSQRSDRAILVEVAGEGHIIMFGSPQIVAQHCLAAASLTALSHE